MRVFIPGPDYPDSFAENVRVALTEMGHSVISAKIVDRGAHYSTASQVIRFVGERVAGDRPSLADKRVLSQVREARCDVLLALTTDLHPEVLEAIGRLGVQRYLWWGDPPANSKRYGLLNPGWDRVFAKDRDAVTALRIAGVEAELLHEACNPRWHRVLAEQANDSLVVAGNYYPYRQAIVSRLLKNGVDVRLYGARPPLWARPEIRQRFEGKYIVHDEKSRTFGAALACLNTVSLAEGNSLNCRAFETAGAGGLLLMQYKTAIEDCFEPGKELLVFRTFDELMDCIERAKSDRESMKMIRAAAARRAHSEHTYVHRLTRILSFVPPRLS